MKIIVINDFMKFEILDVPAVPRVGDKIDVFFEPLPSVTSVVWFPSKERLKPFFVPGTEEKIDAILSVR